MLIHKFIFFLAQEVCKKIIEIQWYLLLHFKHFDMWIPKMQDERMRNFVKRKVEM